MEEFAYNILKMEKTERIASFKYLRTLYYKKRYAVLKALNILYSMDVRNME